MGRQSPPISRFCALRKTLGAAARRTWTVLFFVRKTLPPIRSTGEWGVHSLIGLSIGLYLLLSESTVRSLGLGNGKLGLFQSLKQLCTQIFALVDYQNALVWLIIVSVFRLWGASEVYAVFEKYSLPNGAWFTGFGISELASPWDSLLSCVYNVQ